MCGFTGFWGGAPSAVMGSKDRIEATARRMAEAIRFRGPDGTGVWCDASKELALAHQRLSILDTSVAGHQPMISPSKRYVIVFNGEVYNARKLKPHMESLGYTFKGHSDTEIMLAMIEHFGLKNAVSQFIGMFAFALWDREEGRLHLVRDRVGVKPLYYGVVGGVLFFGSQLQSFRPHPKWNPRIDQSVVPEYFAYNYIPAHRCIYQGMQQVTPGVITTVHWDHAHHLHTHHETYWSVLQARRNGTHERANSLKNDEEHIHELHELLKDAVDLRMVSDVPIGAFLSGGIDSSLVVALMAHHRPDVLRTFTIGFEEAAFNEASFAEDIAAHIRKSIEGSGTSLEHDTYYVSTKDAQNVVQKLPAFYDEPFADSSQIPTYLVASRPALVHVPVVLSGDGGDEFFQGYTRYAQCQKIWKCLSLLPAPLYKALSPAARHLAHPRYAPLLSAMLKMSHVSDKMQKLSQLLHASSIEELFHGIYLFWQESDLARMFPGQPLTSFKTYWHSIHTDFPASQNVEDMQCMDALMYLPCDILTKVDRATMAHSIEAREPLLDHRVIEKSFALPAHLKMQNGKGKIALRRILNTYVPPSLIERPKQGFGVPVGAWIKGPLCTWATDLLSKKALEQSGIQSPEVIMTKFHEHLKGERNWTYALWGALMYQAWHVHNQSV